MQKTNSRRIKHHFREWRHYRGISQERCAAQLGWSQSKLSRIESGKVPYNEDDLIAAAKVYQCMPADLINLNPLVDGELVDILVLVRRSSAKARRAVITFLKSFDADGQGGDRSLPDGPER